MYICFISSHPVHHRRSCISCPSNLRLMNCTSSPNTSALRVSRGMNAAERRQCDPGHAVSGINVLLRIFSLRCTWHWWDWTSDFIQRFFFFSFFSPGRSPSCYDHEIIMMNHVYKERFPKVRTHKTLQFCLTTNYLHYQTCSVASFCRPQLRWRKGFRRSSAATLLRPSSPWQMACLALPITR